MAYDPNQQDPNQQQNQQAQPNMMMTSSAPSSGPASSQGKGTAPQSTPAQPFQNLQAYLSANAPQVQAQADKIASGLTNQYGQIQSDVNKAQTDFDKQIQGGYAAPNADLTNQAASDPTAFVANPDNVKAFQSLYNDTYNGPANFESSTPYGDLTGEISKGASNASNFNSIPGMQTYFQGQNPNATQGGNTLDAVLLQGNPNAIGTVQNAAKPFGTLQDFLTNATTTADKAVTDAQQTAQNESKSLQDQFTGDKGIIPGFQNTLNQNLSTAQQQALDRENQVKAALGITDTGASGNITSQLAKIPDQAFKDLGITRDQLASMESQRDFINRVPGNAPLDLASYLGLTQQSPEAAINMGNFSSSADYAKAAALQQLTGKDMTGSLNPANASQAGTANLDLTKDITPDQIAALLKLYQSQPGVPAGNLPGYTPPPTAGGNSGSIGFGSKFNGVY